MPPTTTAEPPALPGQLTGSNDRRFIPVGLVVFLMKIVIAHQDVLDEVDERPDAKEPAERQDSRNALTGSAEVKFVDANRIAVVFDFI